MNIKKIILFVLILVIGILALRSYWGNLVNSKEQGVFKKYTSENPALNFTFEYPEKNWLPKEGHGSGQVFDSVQLLGPRDAQNQYSVNISVVVKPLNPKQSLADSAASFLESMKRFTGFKIAKNEKIKIQESIGQGASYEYFLRLPFWKKNAKNVLIKETVFFLMTAEKSYRITYSGTSEQYKNSRQVFEHFLKTFRFKK